MEQFDSFMNSLVFHCNTGMNRVFYLYEFTPFSLNNPNKIETFIIRVSILWTDYLTWFEEGIDDIKERYMKRNLWKSQNKVVSKNYKQVGSYWPALRGYKK